MDEHTAEQAQQGRYTLEYKHHFGCRNGGIGWDFLTDDANHLHDGDKDGGDVGQSVGQWIWVLEEDCDVQDA